MGYQAYVVKTVVCLSKDICK